jgi:hypothetical protein
MGKQRVLLEFFESGFGVVVIHGSPSGEHVETLLAA